MTTVDRPADALDPGGGGAAILCVGTTPAVQRVMRFRRVVLDAVNRASATLDGVAGKAVNVAKVLQALGEHPVAVGFLGGARGNAIAAALTARGIAQEFVTVSVPTRECVTVIDEAAGTHTELVEESRPVEPEAFERLEGIVKRRLVACRAVVMSGTLTPGAPVDWYRCCTEWTRAAGAIAVVDAQGAVLREALRARPGLVKPNRTELSATLGRALPDEAATLRAMQELVEAGPERIVVTAGREPAVAYDGRSFWRIRPPRLEVVNPIGSGDAFTAGLIARLVRGDDLGEACRWGTAAGAANALTPMAGEVHREEVHRLASLVAVERIDALARVG